MLRPDQRAGRINDFAFNPADLLVNNFAKACKNALVYFLVDGGSPITQPIGAPRSQQQAAGDGDTAALLMDETQVWDLVAPLEYLTRARSVLQAKRIGTGGRAQYLPIKT